MYVKRMNFAMDGVHVHFWAWQGDGCHMHHLEQLPWGLQGQAEEE